MHKFTNHGIFAVWRLSLLSLVFNWTTCHEHMEVYLCAFLTSAVGEGEWSSSCTCHFTSGERATGAHWMGGWISPMSGLGAVGKRKSYPCSDLNTKGNLLRTTTHPLNLQFSPYCEVIDFQSLNISSVHFGRNLQQ
jgi:hypothetical protein